MSDNVIRAPARSSKEQFSKGSEAWKEQSDPIFRFSTEGDWWGFPFFSLTASRYFGDRGTLCLYWPLGTVVITGPKVLDFLPFFSICVSSSLALSPEIISDAPARLNNRGFFSSHFLVKNRGLWFSMVR
jgi:hypothetical protein